MTLPLRHPRYTVALVLLFITILYALHGLLGPVSGRPYFNKPAPTALYIEDQIKVNEMHYQDHLQNRKDLIKKYGPTTNEIESFPTHGEFYTLWDFFIPAFQCPHRVQRVGTLGDGGKWVCGLERIARKNKCIIYSFGLNGESSFEADLLTAAPGCQVFGYDFSVDGFGPEVENTHLKSRSHFWPFALGSTDAHSGSDHPPTYTLKTLMTQNGHSFIDILKVDIEGSEFETFQSILSDYAEQESLPFGQLQLEIHADGHNHFPTFLDWWEKLEVAGLRPFWTEPNLVYVNVVRGALPSLAEYSFINIKGNHELLK